jgi:hypothetical protein
MTTTNGGKVISAEVQLLTAEVRVVMVGSRQVTLSVYRQLDWVAHHDIEPFGRVHDRYDTDGIDQGHSGTTCYVIGKQKNIGALVRSKAPRVDYFHQLRNADKKPGLTTWAASKHLPWGRHVYNDYDRIHVPIIEDGNDVVVVPVNVTKRYCDEHKTAEAGSQLTWSGSVSALERDLVAEGFILLGQQRHLRALYEQWITLPLIVLAGLR